MDLSYVDICDIQNSFHTFANKNASQKPTKRRAREKKPRNKTDPLKPCYHATDYMDPDTGKPVEFECGIDEAGRGPLFGRVYCAAVILPKDPEAFDHSRMKDSKRFTSKKKLMEVYDYIKENAIAYHVAYADEDTIDTINIRQATLQTMHSAIRGLSTKPDFLLVDGCDFIPYDGISHTCIEGGDNWYTPIAAASILAKVERDLYIEAMCDAHPELEERYNLRKNKGYGAKAHLDGIKEHGITIWHRRTFGTCRKYANISAYK